MGLARKCFAAAALIVALASIAWWGARGDRDVNSAAALEPPDSKWEAPPSPSELSAVANAREASASAPAEEPPQPRVATASERTVHGRLVVEDGDKPVEDATATITLRTAVELRGAPPIRNVDVTVGRFEFTVRPTETRATILEVRVGDRPASVITREIALDGEGEVRVVARLGAGVLLHVVDAVSRAELGDVSIVTGPKVITLSTFEDSPSRCPTPEMLAEPLVEHGTSPLLLPASAHAESYWVTAGGCEWKRIFVAGQSGERTVALGPGCELLVHLPATPPPKGALRLVVDGDDPDAHLALQPLDPASEPTVLITGLPPGACRASIESGRRTVDSFASRALTLNAGERTRWDVEWTSLESAPRSTLRIVVRAKSAPPSDARDAKYDILRIDAAAKSVGEQLVANSRPLRLDEASGDYSATVPFLGAGTYLVAVSPWGQLRTIEIVAGIDATCEFDPSIRIACTVRVVDAASGEPLPNSQVVYANVARGEKTKHWFSATEHDASGSAWRVCVEPGNLEFAFTAPGSGGLRRYENVVSSDQVITAELWPSADLPLVIRLMQGDAEYPIKPDHWVTVEIESGPPGGSATRKQFGSTGIDGVSSSMVMRVTAAGTYVLRIPPVVCGGADDQLVTVEVKSPDGATVEL